MREIYKSINLLLIGFLSSLLIFMVLWTFFASVLTNYFGLFLKEEMEVLFFLILSCYLISILACLIIALVLFKEYKGRVILAFLLSLILNVVSFIFISIVTLLITYPDLFQDVSGIDIFLNSIQYVSIFSIYVIGHPMNLIIIMIFTHLLLLILILKLIT